MIRVCVESVWPGYNQSCAFTGRCLEGKLYRFLSSEQHLLKVGEVWDLEGKTVEHEKYGRQMQVARARWVRPSGRILVDFLTKHEAFRGIGLGVTRASALWKCHGQALFDLLETGDLDALLRADKCQKEMIERMLKVWSEVMKEGHVIRWLTAYDFPPGLARKVLDNYGEDALGRIQDNPYKLLAFVSWSKCDEVARSLGVAEGDPRRRVAVVQECLYRNLGKGSTRMSRISLEAACRPFFRGDSAVLASAAVDVSVGKRAVHERDGWVSTLGVRMLEIDAMQRFESLLSEDPVSQLELFSESDANAVKLAIRNFERSVGYELNEAQRDGVKMALTHRFSVLTGGAGVGKTTVLRALVEHYGDSLYLMALTGQAAKRMMEATSHPATTIARFLLKVVGSISPNSTPFIVIDEASMLDLPLTTSLLRALPQNARVLLVGDPEQLPPVGFGLIFHRIVKSSRVPRTELTVINRQTESSGIPHVSRDVRDGRVPSLLRDVDDEGVSFVEVPKDGILQRLIELKADYPNAQILCPKNGGGVGVADVNQMFHRIYSSGKKALPETNLSIGDPVIFKKNDSSLGLVNGSLGVIEEIRCNTKGEWEVVADFSGSQTVISGERISNLKLAYALTVHSAQGSQFESIIIIIERSVLLDRTWVYTALTRGVSQVIFVGDRQAFGRAISDPPKAHKRDVLFTL